MECLRRLILLARLMFGFDVRQRRRKLANMKSGIGPGIVRSMICPLVLSWALKATAATVGVGLFSLSPNPVNIKVGEVVFWEEADPDFAPYTISGPWGSFVVPGGIQFNAQGNVNYTAQSIFGGSWGGTVHVGPNALPTVTITSPTNNAMFTAPASFAFEADAYDADPGDVWDVEFWIGNAMVDDVYSAPYATTVTNLAAGTYTLKAIVWDYSSAKATNSITIRVVNSGPITLAGSALAAGKFVFNASGLTPGKTNVLQSSTNPASPLSWGPVSTNVAGNSTASFTNTVAAGAHFFRILQLP